MGLPASYTTAAVVFMRCSSGKEGAAAWVPDRSSQSGPGRWRTHLPVRSGGCPSLAAAGGPGPYAPPGRPPRRPDRVYVWGRPDGGAVQSIAGPDLPTQRDDEPEHPAPVPRWSSSTRPRSCSGSGPSARPASRPPGWALVARWSSPTPGSSRRAGATSSWATSGRPGCTRWSGPTSPRTPRTTRSTPPTSGTSRRAATCSSRSAVARASTPRRAWRSCPATAAGSWTTAASTRSASRSRRC